MNKLKKYGTVETVISIYLHVKHQLFNPVKMHILMNNKRNNNSILNSNYQTPQKIL